MDTESFLQENQENLNNILKPFQQELNRGQRLADFLKQCVRCLGRDDFLQLEELLNSKIAKKNSIPLDTIEKMAGEKALKKTSAGQYIKVNGAWKKK